MGSVLSLFKSSLNWEDEFCTSLHTNAFSWEAFSKTFLVTSLSQELMSFSRIPRKECCILPVKRCSVNTLLSCPAFATFSPVRSSDCGHGFPVWLWNEKCIYSAIIASSPWIPFLPLLLGTLPVKCPMTPEWGSLHLPSAHQYQHFEGEQP